MDDVGPDNTPERQIEAVRMLVAEIPGADRVLAEHLADNEAVLPYVLINDLARFYGRAFEDGDDRVVRATAGALEPMSASTDEDVSGLVVEFLQTLASRCVGGRTREIAAVAALRAATGPVTAERLDNAVRLFGLT